METNTNKLLAQLSTLTEALTSYQDAASSDYAIELMTHDRFMIQQITADMATEINRIRRTVGLDQI